MEMAPGKVLNLKIIVTRKVRVTKALVGKELAGTVCKPQLGWSSQRLPLVSTIVAQDVLDGSMVLILLLQAQLLTILIFVLTAMLVLIMIVMNQLRVK